MIFRIFSGEAALGSVDREACAAMQESISGDDLYGFRNGDNLQFGTTAECRLADSYYAALDGDRGDVFQHFSLCRSSAGNFHRKQIVA